MKAFLTGTFVALIAWHMCGHIVELAWGRQYTYDHRSVFRFFGVVWMPSWQAYDLFWASYIFLELLVGLAAILKK